MSGQLGRQQPLDNFERRTSGEWNPSRGFRESESGHVQRSTSFRFTLTLDLRWLGMGLGRSLKFVASRGSVGVDWKVETTLTSDPYIFSALFKSKELDVIPIFIGLIKFI